MLPLPFVVSYLGSLSTRTYPMPRTGTAQGRIEVCALTTFIDFRPHGLVSETPSSLPDQNHGISTLDVRRLRSMDSTLITAPHAVRCLCSFSTRLSFLIFFRSHSLKVSHVFASSASIASTLKIYSFAASYSLVSSTYLASGDFHIFTS